jgi:amino acid adenylation domain-containing protein
MQVIAPERRISVPATDLTGMSAAAREEVVRYLAHEEAHWPFDLTRGPLVRLHVWKLGDDDHVLLLTTHHIVADASSMGVLTREIATLYPMFARGERPTLPPPRVQYADFALWQRRWLSGIRFEQQLRYWKRQLDGAPEALQLPTDRPLGGAHSSGGATVSRRLNGQLVARLNDLARAEDASLFMTLLAAFNALLARYTGQVDLLVGTQIGNRHDEALEALVGLFVTTLVLRINVSGDPSFRELLARVRETTLGAFAHPDLPIVRLVEELAPSRRGNGTPILPVMFLLQNTPIPTLELPGLRVRAMPLDHCTAKCDLTFEVVPDADGLMLWAEYRTALFDAATFDRLLANYERLLTAVVSAPDAHLSTLPLLSAAERRVLVETWNASDTTPTGGCLHTLVEQQVARTPQAVAVEHEGQRLTYAELNRRANQVAWHLRARGATKESTVGLCLERSLDLIVGVLAILKTGAAYVPLDPTYPADRLRFLIVDAEVAMVVTHARTRDRLEAIPDGVVIDLDAESDVIEQQPHKNPDIPVSPDDLAYVIYTSGSTGRPKGVAIRHHGAAVLVQWAHTVFTPQETAGVLASTSLAFDLSVFELFVPLTSGGRVVLVRQVCDLSRYVATDTVTLVNTVPSAMAELLRLRAVPASVRVVNLAGEALSPALVAQVHAVETIERLVNLYGPSETTTYSTYAELRRDSARTVVPIGRPVSHTRVYVLDAAGEPVPIGVTGELYIGGAGVARGYLNRPDLTEARFVPDPFGPPDARLYRTGDLARWCVNGELEFLGRMDHQVKLRGYRIELGEIEATLDAQPGVRRSVVVAREDTPNKRLVAYVEREPEALLTEKALRAALQTRLPEFMVPSAVVVLDALPQTPNGKVNRAALPAPPRESPHVYVTPSTPTERALAAIWADVLRRARVGVHDNFFDLGGHSLLAARVFAEVEQQFGRRLPVGTLVEAPTIAQLADVLERRAGSVPWSPLVELQGDGFLPPFFLIHGIGGEVLNFTTLAHHLAPDQPVYGIRAKGSDDLEEPLPDIESMAALYVDAIRSLAPEGPYYIGGYSSGGTLALEMAQQLRARGEEVALLAMIDSEAPESHAGERRWRLRHVPAFLGNVARWAIQDDFFRSGAAPMLENVRSKLRLLRSKVTSPLTRRGSADIRDVLRVWQFPDKHRPFLEAHHRALSNYRPKPYPGPIILIRAGTLPLFSPPEYDLGWGRIATDRLEIKVIPGAHDNILVEPRVRLLAAVLRACLRESAAMLPDVAKILGVVAVFM